MCVCMCYHSLATKTYNKTLFIFSPTKSSSSAVPFPTLGQSKFSKYNNNNNEENATNSPRPLPVLPLTSLSLLQLSRRVRRKLILTMPSSGTPATRKGTVRPECAPSRWWSARKCVASGRWWWWWCRGWAEVVVKIKSSVRFTEHLPSLWQNSCITSFQLHHRICISNFYVTSCSSSPSSR